MKNIYRETTEAYNNGLNLLCIAGLLAIIAGSKHEQVKNRPVEKHSQDGTIKIVRSENLIAK